MSGKYKIGMASKQSGVSPQTVRYYEKENLFTSVKNDPGNTRYYNARHFKWLSNIRRYFKCGFSEREVRELVHCQTLTEMTGIIDRKVEEARGELAELRRRIEALDALAYNVKRIDTLMGRIVLEHNPSMAFLVVREGNRILQGEKTEHMLAKWLENIQFTRLGSIIPQHILKEEPQNTYRLSGHCVPTSSLPQLHCAPDDPVLRIFPPMLCIHTVCELSTEEGLSPDKLLPHMYAYLEDFQLRICGDAFGQVLAVLDEGATAENSHPKATYYEYWIPVDKI